MIESSIYGWSFFLWFFHIWCKVTKDSRYILNPYFLLLSYSQVDKISTTILGISVVLLLVECLPSVVTEKLQLRAAALKLSIFSAGHKRKCLTGRLYCTNCPKFSKTSQPALVYHVTKKCPRVRTKSTYRCNICLEFFSGFYALQKHRNSQHGIPTRTSNLDKDNHLEYMDDTVLKEEPG